MNAQKCGEFIAELRKEQNLTQKDLADKINVSDKAISRWETGKGFPDVDSLQALSKFFNITINELLAGEKAEIETIEEKSGKKIKNKKIEILAEENILLAIKENNETKKENKINNIIFHIIVTALILIPFFIKLSKNPIQLSFENTFNINLLRNMVFSLISLTIGVLVYTGHYKGLIHKSRYHNVTNIKSYCKAMGSGFILLSITTLFYSISILLFGYSKPSTIEIITIISTYSIIIIYLIVKQINYNGNFS